MYVDADGVPYSDYGLYRGLEIGRQRSILAVAERGLWYWNEYLSGTERRALLSYDWTKWPANFDEFRPDDAAVARRMLVNCADWLLAGIEERRGFSVWTYPYPFSYHTAPGWRSAHAQAAGLQLLARTAGITGDRRYLIPVASLLAAFAVDVGAGGLATRTQHGNMWFEKMADAGNRQPKVLNGLLFTIIGLKDVAQRTRIEEADRLAELGIQAAVELLQRFDLGDWSAYDIHGKRASRHYHQIHIAQLARLSGEAPEFAVYHDRFLGYLDRQ